MHDVSSIGRSECESIASFIDSHLCVPGGPYVNGAKIVAIPDKLSVQEYMNLADIWPLAFGLIASEKHMYIEDVKQSYYHWKIIEILRRKLDRLAFGPPAGDLAHSCRMDM